MKLAGDIILCVFDFVRILFFLLAFKWKKETKI